MDINGLIEPFQQFADHLQGFPEQAQPAAEQPAQGTEGLESQQPATDGAENAPGSAPEAPQGEAPPRCHRVRHRPTPRRPRLPPMLLARPPPRRTARMLLLPSPSWTPSPAACDQQVIQYRTVTLRELT